MAGTDTDGSRTAQSLARDGRPDLALAAAEDAIATWRTLADDNPAAFGDRLAGARDIRDELIRGGR